MIKILGLIFIGFLLGVLWVSFDSRIHIETINKIIVSRKNLLSVCRENFTFGMDICHKVDGIEYCAKCEEGKGCTPFRKLEPGRIDPNCQTGSCIIFAEEEQHE